MGAGRKLQKLFEHWQNALLWKKGRMQFVKLIKRVWNITCLQHRTTSTRGIYLMLKGFLISQAKAYKKTSSRNNSRHIWTMNYTKIPVQISQQNRSDVSPLLKFSNWSCAPFQKMSFSLSRLLMASQWDGCSLYVM